MMQFNIEKKREDGATLDIRILLMNKKFKVEDVGVKLKGKRKFIYQCGSSLTDCYSYRALNEEGRRKMREEKMLEVCSKSTLQEAVYDAWKQLEPKEVF